MSNNRSYSVNDFKHWLSQQQDVSKFFSIGLDRIDEEDELVGKRVKARVSANKLLEKIECDEDDPQSLLADFLKSGGSILESKDKRYLIEVESGSFSLPKFCVKVKKD